MSFNVITLIGLIAAACTTIAFVPQVLKTWKSKTAKDLSLGTFSLFTTGIVLWLVYGFLIMDLPIIAANAVTLLLVAAILFFKLTFDREQE
ncbi:MAG: SemiSWEET transporter [Balneolaceae bacterium]